MKLLYLIILVLSLIGVTAQSDCEEGELRMKTRYYGFYPYHVIQVCSNVTGSLDWTYICYDSDWDVNSVNVYCRQLDYLRAKNVSSTFTDSYRTTFSYLSGTAKIENVDCIGDEETLLNCDFSITTSECHLTEYNPSDHCTNESIIPNITILTNSTVDSSTASTVSITKSTVDSSTASTVSITKSTVDSSTASTVSITDSPVDSLPISPTTITKSTVDNLPVSTVSITDSPVDTKTDSPGVNTLDPNTTPLDSLDDVTTVPHTNSLNSQVDMVSQSPIILNSNSQGETKHSKSTDTIPTENPSNDPSLKLASGPLQIVLPVLVVVIFGSVVSTVLIITLVCCCSRNRKKKDSNEESNYCTIPVVYDSTEQSYAIQQYCSDIELSALQNGNVDFMTSNIYASISEQYKTNMDYAVVKPTRLDSEYVDTVYDPNRDAYYSKGLYDGMVEGEVGDSSLYDFLPGFNPFVSDAAAYEIPRSNSILANEFAEGASPSFIEPPDNLPELENVFGHCMHEIDRQKIDLQKEFASGQFGVVYRAVYHTQRGDIPVAIKTLKETSDADTKVAFMREAAILAQFQHPNVLRLIGVLTAQQPYMMVTELLKTELREFLASVKASDSHKTVDISPLFLKFSTEISAGMEHLSEKLFIHRDLAARNVLVAKDLSCRIADFGMSRELISDSEYYTSSGGRIPLRWTAPEAVFYQKYSEKSDVWSFGMTLFEIWSLGGKPWGNDATNEEIVEGLSEGRKLSPPTGCPRDVYSVMVDTWRMDSSSRPTFSTILRLLTNVHLSVAPPVSPETDPALCLGNDPMLSKDHYPDLQTVY